MRLQEVYEKLQKNEIWRARPAGYWRYERAHLAVVGMGDRLTLFHDPFEVMDGGILKEAWRSQPFIPTFEDMKRDDWEAQDG